MDWIGDILPNILTGVSVVIGIVGLVTAVVGAIPSGGMSLAAVGPILGAIGAGVARTVVVGGVTYVVSGWTINELLPDTFYLPAYLISPSEIFSNQIPLLDVNFFNPHTDEYYQNAQTGINQALQGNSDQPQSTAAQLQGVISSWYYTIRTIALIALLSILLYIGIRIVISSSAQDKAKYKQRFVDWLIGICLLFFLNYIMSFAITVSELVTQSLNSINQHYYTYVRR